MLVAQSLLPSPSQESRPLQWIEFFAGKAEATRMFRQHGFDSAKLDIQYMKANGDGMNPMDLCTDAGFAFLGWSFRNDCKSQLGS